ncbi:hypothetical protein ACRJ4W_35555 [Streptomyces sp. GLT-R25]
MSAEVGLEGGDVADDVGAQVLQELGLEAGEVVVGETVVQLPVAVRCFDAAVEVGGELTVGVPEGGHLRGCL